jgi:(1->4)-alpha-D-glucan 1-alpha-D-glucosylmutase
VATYRLQFNGRFTFRDAEAIVDYLRSVGVTDVYASSYLKAVPGSEHGYNVADPTRLNPELGSDADYWRWVEKMRALGMGHVLDLVPNHMGIAKSANPWWLDVLENGPSSRFAHFFDVEWRPVKDELADKVLIPILGGPYGDVLERQELVLQYENGAFHVRYFDERLPIAPDTLRLICEATLDAWVAAHAGSDADELLSVLNAAEHLPSRSSRDPDAIAVRAREKEVLKRRLAALVDQRAAVRSYVDDTVKAANGRAGDPRSFDRLDALLNAQSYRLAHWLVASEEINYRRFFDVNQLAALRMEDPTVFSEVHRFVFDLIARGGPTGLRVDHVDGLFAPRDYLQRLQDTVAQPTTRFFIVVEKILGPSERLPAEWPVAGTTGYEFAAMVNQLFVDGRNERALDDIYRRFTRERTPYGDLVYRSKKQVLHETMSGDINSIAHQLNRFSERNRHFRDFTLYSLISTLKEVIACFPVYRTYITAREPVSDDDRSYIGEAVRCAKRRSPRPAAMVFDFVERILLKETAATTADACEDHARLIGKFQQVTSPVAAKGIEDTVYYVYNRLLSLNEVGSDPTRFGVDPATVHAWMRERQERWPAALSTTATHDTKRGEDVRARLNVLSEIPGAWKAAVTRWRALNRRFRLEVHGAPAPDPNEEYFLYQTLVGAWPFDPAEQGAPFRDRIASYMTKAMREAKVHTSWFSPDEERERAVLRFVDGVLDPRRSGPFLQSFAAFQARVAEAGIYNSLAQLLIKITAPGIPDFYQGTELWDLNLVDPDNRRPVHYDTRRQRLSEMRTSADPDELLANRRDGRIKMFITARALAARAALRSVFEEGEYVPLPATGLQRESVFAFARRHADQTVVVCVPRLIAALLSEVGGPPLGAVWGDTRVDVPGGRYRNAFTGMCVETQPDAGGASLAAATMFDRLPVALLTPCST